MKAEFALIPEAGDVGDALDFASIEIQGKITDEVWDELVGKFWDSLPEVKGHDWKLREVE